MMESSLTESQLLKKVEKEWKGPVFLTPAQLSMMLNVSQVAIYKWVRLKKIPFFHIEKAVRFHPEEIRTWLEEKRGGEYHRDKEKEPPKAEGPPAPSASTGGK